MKSCSIFAREITDDKECEKYFQDVICINSGRTATFASVSVEVARQVIAVMQT
ncbi:hypothetical protein [Aliterella atlantica]|uniref:hypothetical protein n=1 Tax=Aliterella atlantica TaxID=1827278 RepID=UPI0030D78A60